MLRFLLWTILCLRSLFSKLVLYVLLQWGNCGPSLLLLCPIAHSLWVHMLQIFGIHWIMPVSIASYYFVGGNGLGSIIHISRIWSQDVWCGSFGCNGIVILSRILRNHWFSCKICANRLFSIGLSVGASWIVLLSWSLLLLLE